MVPQCSDFVGSPLGEGCLGILEVRGPGRGPAPDTVAPGPEGPEGLGGRGGVRAAGGRGWAPGRLLGPPEGSHHLTGGGRGRRRVPSVIHTGRESTNAGGESVVRRPPAVIRRTQKNWTHPPQETLRNGTVGDGHFRDSNSEPQMTGGKTNTKDPPDIFEALRAKFRARNDSI